MQFENLPLRVPKLEKVEQKFKELSDAFDAASTKEEALKVIKKAFKYEDELETDFTIISIRYSINTADKKLIKATEICDEINPEVANFQTSFNEKILNSEFRPYLEQTLGEHLFKIYENDKLCFDPIIIEDLVEENKLVNKYDTLMASGTVEFDGKTLALTQLGKYMSSKDRDTRIAAAHAYWDYLKSKDDEIGDIYDKLVKVRTKMAKKLGYDSFTEFGYKRLGRLDYNASMVEGYRDQIKTVVVPEVEKLVKRQAKRIGIKKPLFYDLSLKFLSGNAVPNGTSAELVEAAKKMYHEMSKETGEFFDFMNDSHLMDLDAKPGKMGGGYMTYLPKYKAPFIFANSNGTASDVDTLTHEFGHAFQGHLGSTIKVPNYRMPTLEACEIDSMSMEFFAYPWMELFFGDQAEKYKFSHLSGAIEFLPYGVAVDEFQHYVYAYPEATHKERCAKWREIDRKYRPWIDYGDFDYLEGGAFWVKQSHIFGTPFYYIDYTLAQVLALQFKCEMDKDREKAWKKYIKLLKLGGKYPFLTLLEKAHLRNPFIDGNVKKVIKPQMKILNSIDDSNF